MYLQQQKFRDACEKGNLGVSKSLITKVFKKSPNYLMPMISSYHYHSLRWTCHNGHLDVVKLLISTDKLTTQFYQ